MKQLKKYSLFGALIVLGTVVWIAAAQLIPSRTIESTHGANDNIEKSKVPVTETISIDPYVNFLKSEEGFVVDKPTQGSKSVELKKEILSSGKLVGLVRVSIDKLNNHLLVEINIIPISPFEALVKTDTALIKEVYRIYLSPLFGLGAVYRNVPDGDMERLSSMARNHFENRVLVAEFKDGKPEMVGSYMFTPKNGPGGWHYLVGF